MAAFSYETTQTQKAMASNNNVMEEEDLKSIQLSHGLHSQTTGNPTHHIASAARMRNSSQPSLEEISQSVRGTERANSCNEGQIPLE